MFGRASVPAFVVHAVHTVGVASSGVPPWQPAHSLPSVAVAFEFHLRLQVPTPARWSVWQPARLGAQVGGAPSVKPTFALNTTPVVLIVPVTCVPEIAPVWQVVHTAVLPPPLYGKLSSCVIPVTVGTPVCRPVAGMFAPPPM